MHGNRQPTHGWHSWACREQSRTCASWWQPKNGALTWFPRTIYTHRWCQVSWSMWCVELLTAQLMSRMCYFRYVKCHQQCGVVSFRQLTIVSFDNSPSRQRQQWSVRLSTTCEPYNDSLIPESNLLINLYSVRCLSIHYYCQNYRMYWYHDK